MKTTLAITLVSALLVSGCAGTATDPAAQAKPLQVLSEKTVKGFAFPESVGYDARARVLYVSEFGSELKPLEKDGKGRISRITLGGEMLDRQVFPAPQGEALNKPKGIWIAEGRLWVTDIDSVWVFDLTSRQGKKLPLPGAQFANDPTVIRGALYVSDNRTDQVFRVEPADFLSSTAPLRISSVFQGKGVNPNGLYPARDGSLLMAGFSAPDQPRGLYSVDSSGAIKTIAPNLGRLDGLYQMDDGSILYTDWASGSLLRWGSAGTQTLAKNFKGPADFCVVPQPNGLLVVVPDLVQGELRFVQLGR